MQPKNVSYIPDSLDALTLNGIVPYDVNAFVYDRKSALQIPQSYGTGTFNNLNNLQNDTYGPKSKKTKRNHKNLKGLAALGVTLASVGLLIAGKKGKLPKEIKLPKISFEGVKKTLENACSAVKKFFTR